MAISWLKASKSVFVWKVCEELKIKAQLKGITAQRIESGRIRKIRFTKKFWSVLL